MTSSLPPLPSRGSRYGNKGPKNKKRKFVKPFIWLVVILLVIAISYVGYLIYHLNSQLHHTAANTQNEANSNNSVAQQTIKSTEPSNTAATTHNSSTKSTDTSKSTTKTSASNDNKTTTSGLEKPSTFLLLGMDTKEKIKTLNTDVIMIVSVNPDKKKAIVISLPRDTYVEKTGLEKHKANALYSTFLHANPASAGSKEKQVFSNYFGVPIPYMATFNFQGFSEVVDQLNGIQVDISTAMCYKDSTDGTNINLHPGVQKLNGKQALDYVRYIRSSCNNSAGSNDLQRNMRQQQVMRSILDRMTSLTSLFKWSHVIDAIGNNTEMDIPKEEVIQMIETYFQMDKQNIKYIHLQGPWESPYIKIDQKQLQQAREALQDIMK